MTEFKYIAKETECGWQTSERQILLEIAYQTKRIADSLEEQLSMKIQKEIRDMLKY